MRRTPEQRAERKAAYHRYLRTGAWKRKRREALDTHGAICADCQRTDRLQVHHLQYPDVFGTEPVATLRVLCSPCHRRQHPDKAFGGTRKESKPPVRGEHRKALRRLRVLARQERRNDKRTGKRPKPVPSTATLLQRIARGDVPAKKPRRNWPLALRDPRPLKDRF